MFIAHSLQLFPGTIFELTNSFELTDEIIVPSYYLNNIMMNMEDNDVLCMNMINTTNNLSYIVAIGGAHTYDKNTIYAPQWILDIIGCTANNSIIKLHRVNMDLVRPATKIVIKPLDPMAFKINTLACFEKALMNIHTIKEGITIAVASEELGLDYTIFAHIEKVEPAPISRISSGEIDVEFINEEEEPATQMVTETANVIEAPNVVEATSTISPEERRQQIRDSWLKRFS
jgi:hypothetical protein